MEGETELEMVRRHVREGEGQVQRQSELLARLQERGAWTDMIDMAVILLEQFEDIQRLHKAHLTRLEARLAC